jgi:4-hydroxybenzoate polyprenyltransferase
VNAAATASALGRSCHPAPTGAVTVFSVLLGVSAGLGAGRTAVLGAAVLAGQLSIGWSNDRLDHRRDRTVHRIDKPIAQHEIALTTVDAAIAVSLLVTAALSLALGWRAGVLHLTAVACGWIYNLGVKATWWSWVPYAAAFGALPAVATLARPDHAAPAWWPLVAGALLGVTANLTNPLPELDDDARTGIRGLPHRIGARPALVLATAALLAASALVVVGPSGSPAAAAWVAFGLAAALALGGLGWAWRRPTSPSAFYGIIAVVAIDVVVIVVAGHGLR